MDYNEAWIQPRSGDPEMPYHCYGHFYQMLGRNCRSTLEIVQNAPEHPNTLLDPDHHRPDIVCVMMNPGGSTPSDPAQDPGACINDPNHILDNGNANLVCTVPDDTQNPIMTMMHCRDLCHVRVLNLFDIRNSNSDNFLSSIVNLHNAYSIFSPERENERQARINPTTGVVVAAWGVDQRLQQRALDCVGLLNDHIHIHGYCNEQGLYYHPKKREGDWLLYILEHWPA